MRLIAAVFLLLAGAVLGWGVANRVGDPTAKLFGARADVATVAAASLASAQREARLTSFAARFTVVVTSEERALILHASKTMIVPGTVRYELDFGKLGPAGLKWNANVKTLLVEAPAIEIAGPQVDLNAIREYSSGGILMALTDAEHTLDAANRARINGAMLAEARAPVLIGLARDATRAAVARTFALPLAAAGIAAKVVVRFPGEPAPAA